MTTKQTVLPLLSPLRQGRVLPGFAMTSALSLALCAGLFSTGCKCSSVDTAAANPGTARSRSASQMSRTEAKSGVRTGAVYQQAVTAYRAHHYADALKNLDTLCATPNLSDQDKAFLERQRILCRAAISGKPPLVTNGAAVSSVGSPSGKAHAVPLSERNCGPRALLLLCQEQHVKATLADLTKAAHTNTDGTSMDGLAQAAQTVGLKATGVQMDKDALTHLSRPAIAWVDGNHYVAVLNVHNDLWTGKPSATIHDPNHPGKEEMALNDLLRRSGGILLTVTQ